MYGKEKKWRSYVKEKKWKCDVKKRKSYVKREKKRKSYVEKKLYKREKGIGACDREKKTKRM